MPAEVSVLTTAPYGVLEIRDVDADVSDDDVLMSASAAIAASSGYHLYLGCRQQQLEVRVTIRLVDEPTPTEEWDGHVAGMELELTSGHLLVMRIAGGPALEWDVPAGDYSVGVSYRGRESAARRGDELIGRAVAEDWPLDRITEQARRSAGIEQYRIDLRRH